MAQTITRAELAYVPLALVDPPSTNVRTTFDQKELEDLAQSIRTHGVLTPLRLRRIAGSDRLQIVAGERRFLAARMAELAEVPAAIEEAGTDAADEARRIGEQIAENDDRVDLTATERMGGVQQLIELGLTDEQVALQIVREPEQVMAMRRILALPAEVRGLIEEGALDLEEAAALAACDDEEIVAAAVELLGSGYNPSAALRQADDTVTRRRVLEQARDKLASGSVPEIHAPEYGSFSVSSKTRPLGKGYGAIHIPVSKHRRQPCHAAYINAWARTLKDAIVYVCTDVSRHAADPDAGVPENLMKPSEDVKQERAARRAEKKAWRGSHEPRRAIVAEQLASLDDEIAFARVAGAVVAADELDGRVAMLALELLGAPVERDDEAVRAVDARLRAASPVEQLHLAVAWLSARAELSMAREHGDWHEHDNVRAHFALVTSLGYEPNDGERAHLERAFSLTSFERPDVLPEHRWYPDGAIDDEDNAGLDEPEGFSPAEAEDEDPASTDAATDANEAEPVAAEME